MKKLVQSVLGLLAIVALTAGAAQAQKIAVIDTRAVLADMPEAQAANTTLENARKAWTDSLQTMQTVYNTKLADYQKLGDNVTPDFKKKSEADLQNLEQAYTTFQQAKFGQQGELAQMQAKLVQPIMEKIKNAIDSFAKKGKVAVIIDKSNALYSEDGLDVTTQFEAYLKSLK